MSNRSIHWTLGAMLLALLCAVVERDRASRRSDQDRIYHVADGRARVVRQGQSARAADLAGADQRPGRIAGPAGRSRSITTINRAPPTIPGIYAKLLDVDKVDLLMGAATNLIVAAMPEIMQRQKMVVVLLALGSNDEFKYPRYFQTAAWGPDTKGVISNAFFEVAKTISPRPKTVAIVGADADFSNNAMTGARANAKKDGFDIVYDRTYPPGTTDYTPIVRAIQATNPDLVFVASYPLDSVGIVRAATELGLKAQMFGGAMVGLQYATFLQQLAEKLDRVVNYHLYVPAPTMNFPGIEEFLKTYQARAAQVGTDPLGFYQPPFAYAAMQVIEQAVKATGTLDDGKLADYIHKNEFNTIVGNIRFDAKGEWAKPRLLMIQYQNIDGSDLDQYRTPGKQVILYPPRI